MSASLMVSFATRGNPRLAATWGASVDFPLAGGPETTTYTGSGGEATRRAYELVPIDRTERRCATAVEPSPSALLGVVARATL